MDKEINQTSKNNLSNNSSPSYNEMNELIGQFHENMSFSGSSKSNKADPRSDTSTFQSDKNTPVSSPLFSHADSSITRSFSVNFTTTEISDFDRSYADLNSVAVGVASENDRSDSDEKTTPNSDENDRSDSDEKTTPNSDENDRSDSDENLSPDQEITENWEDNSNSNSNSNSENNNSPVHSAPFDTFQENQEIQEEQEEDENLKRIKDWINKIEIADMIVEETGECGSSSAATSALPVSPVSGKILAGLGPVDPKQSVSMAMGYNYISAMNPLSASAQLSSFGLVAIPILSAFGGLRELSLSKNNILRITAGALPKGLHVLNLSKNYISTIEGLKDLTRLRVLDLSHNRISRIGHGLASCSSIKELYLSSNKISEIEGLHRLLKLKILDLRSNKLSTAKGLEQLAANYGSLEGISLDGNPAQRNVGDEHLKKYLLTLLPRLVYYNRHSVNSRGGSSKDRIVSSRRSGGSGRNDRKSRNGRNGGRKGRNVNLLPPSGGGGLRFENAGRRVSGLNPLRRVVSEGAFGAVGV